jgi:hypothetical protein
VGGTQLIVYITYIISIQHVNMTSQDRARRGSATPTMDPSSSSSHYFESSTSLFVGSPDSLSYNFPSRPSRPKITTPPPSSRSISTPSVLRRGLSTDQRISSGVMGLQRGTPNPEHQWTLFGQLMENEGQLPSPRSISASSSRNKVSTPRRNEHDASWSGSAAARRSNGDPLLDVHWQSAAEDNDPAESSDDTARLPRRTYSTPSAENDSNYDSDSDSDTTDPPSPISPETSERKASGSFINRIPPMPVLYRNVLKCSIAYFIASLFTFSPHLSSFISDLTSHGPGPHTPFPSGHMVATM